MQISLTGLFNLNKKSIKNDQREGYFYALDEFFNCYIIKQI